MPAICRCELGEHLANSHLQKRRKEGFCELGFCKLGFCKLGFCEDAEAKPVDMSRALTIGHLTSSGPAA